MKKLNFLKYVLLCVIILATGCQKEDELITEQDVINNNELQTDTDFENDVFVDGVNQTFLQETGMTVEELEQMVAQQAAEDQAEFTSVLEKQAANFSSYKYSEKKFTFDENELAGAVGALLFDIQQNADKYFEASIGLNTSLGTFLELGLSEQLIKNAVAAFPTVRNHTSKQKLDLHGFSLESLEASGTTIKIKFKGNARYRHYIKIFKKYRKVLDRSGSAHVELPLYFNTSSNKITSGTLKISRINIKNKFIDIVFLIKSTIIKLIINKFVVIKKDINLDISYDFISKFYVDFKYFSKSNGKVFFTFKIKTDDLIDSIKNLLKAAGII